MPASVLLRRWICSTEPVVKSPNAMLLLSILNLGVVAGVLVYVFRTTPPSVRVEPAAAETLASSAPVAPTEPEKIVERVVVTNDFRWAQLESEDYKTYIARLRSVGCPEETIRDIIIADLDKLMASEIATAIGRRKDLRYWHPEEEEMLNDVDPSEAHRQQRQVEQRKQEIIRELVGADLARERMKQSGQEDYYERRLKFLPEERRTQVRELLAKYDDLESRVRPGGTEDLRPLSVAQRAHLRILQQQREDELAKILSPDEKKQFDLWLSPTANDIRHGLYGMNASEQEFQAIYQARKAFEEKWGHREPDLMDAATREKMDADRGDMEGQIEQSLGAERYADYQRRQDDDFHVLSGLATRHKLPREKAAEVHGYKQVAQNYRQQVLANTELTPQQKQEALRAIADETRKTVEATLGPRAFNEFLRSGRAGWIGE